MKELINKLSNELINELHNEMINELSNELIVGLFPKLTFPKVLGLSPNGLLGNARKFNVAITRGQALCVVVGKPVLLCTDPYFKHYVRACAQRGSHYGVPCPAFDAAPGSRMGKLDMAAASAESFDALGAGSSQVMGVHQEMRGESFESSQRISWNLESTWRNML